MRGDPDFSLNRALSHNQKAPWFSNDLKCIALTHMFGVLRQVIGEFYKQIVNINVQYYCWSIARGFGLITCWQ